MNPRELPEGHRSGFIAIAGRPNVGKSTLVNRLLQQQIAAVSPRPQTTRRKQLGILTLPNAQLIFVDTPGIHQPLHQLGERMNREAVETLGDVDLILAMFDLDQPPNEEDQQVVNAIISLPEKPRLLGVLNKADLVPHERLSERRAAYRTLLPEANWITISAVEGHNIDKLLDNILNALPPGPQYFPPDQITDTYERDISADLIRAAGMHYLQNEVPHSIAVRIDTFEERQEHGAYIEATLFVERDSQKGIVIGKGGGMLKRIGTHARKEIEAVTGRKVFLRLRVKVLPGWRNDENALRQFGFQPTKDQP